MQSPIRTAAAGLIGNVLEWFDFAAYTFVAKEIGAAVTPEAMDADKKQLVAYALLAIGFIARPIGGLTLGPIGDRIGRRALMTLSILMMGLATLTIGLLPTYKSVGFAAPVLLVLCRLVQGFSLGGEFTGSMVYTTELASPKWRGIIASSTAAGTTLGFILGSATGWLLERNLTHADLAGWGWRVPFIVSVVFCILGWFLRHGLHESAQTQKSAAERAPILESLVADWKPILQTFAIVGLTNAAYYLVFAFNLDQRKAESSDFALANTIDLFVVLAAKIFGGWLSDHIGRRRMMIALTVIMTAGMYPGVHLMLYGGVASFMLGQLLLGVPIAMAFGLQGAMCVEIFPLRTRVTSMSFAYSITVALAGGLVGVVATSLIKSFDSAMAPAIYVMLYGVIGLPLIWRMHETNSRSLDH